MKKKLFATLMMVMALSLTACSGETASTGSSVTDAEIEATDNTETEELEEPEISDEDAEDEFTVTEEEAPKQNGVFGYVDGIVYTNEFFGLKYLAGPGYMFLDDRMIGRITDAGSEMMGDDSLIERLESGATVIDFAVADTMMTSSVNFVIGQHDNTAPEMSREELEERIDLMIPLQVEKYENMGATDIVCERSTATLLGEEVPCITLKVNYLGTEINMLMTFIIKDNYSATITVQAATDEKISQLLSFFVPIQ